MNTAWRPLLAEPLSSPMVASRLQLPKIGGITLVTSRFASSPDISVELLGFLVPADAVTDTGTQLPPPRLRRRVERDEEAFQLPTHGVADGFVSNELFRRIDRAPHDHRHRPPPSPVLRAHLRQARKRDSARLELDRGRSRSRLCP